MDDALSLARSRSRAVRDIAPGLPLTIINPFTANAIAIRSHFAIASLARPLRRQSLQRGGGAKLDAS